MPLRTKESPHLVENSRVVQLFVENNLVRSSYHSRATRRKVQILFWKKKTRISVFSALFDDWSAPPAIFGILTFFFERMKTEDKNSVNSPRVRIVVLGMISVGKSALTVRYLTRRYIGEYRSNTDLLYRQTVTINNSPVEVEIIDVSGETRDSSLPSEPVQWADGCVIVYSITDRQSFQYAVDALDTLHKLKSSGTITVPVTLLANKADLAHLREVTEEEGRSVASKIGCQFYEISVAENSSDLYQAFEYLLTETKNQQGGSKGRKFSVSKMIGTLIGGKGASQQALIGQQHSGTVVVCHKSDLHRSRVLKRRQNFTATASL